MQKELNECLEISRKIKEIKEKTFDLQMRCYSPKSQVISDMPRGGAVENATERYLIDLERLNNKREALEAKRSFIWNSIKIKMNKCGLNEEYQRMLRFRFYNAYSWNKCTALLSELYENSNWNANKCFRVYRQILNKMHKKYTKHFPLPQRHLEELLQQVLLWVLCKRMKMFP